MAAKSQYSSPEAEYVESPDRPSIRDLASKWNQPVSSLLKQSSKERWTEKRNQFGIKLESKTTEKTVEKVSEKVSTDKAEVIARQVKNSRGLQSIGVALGVKLQGALAQLGAVLENNGYIFCGHCGKSTPTKCGKCGMMHETTPLRPDQAKVGAAGEFATTGDFQGHYPKVPGTNRNDYHTPKIEGMYEHLHDEYDDPDA